MEQAQQLIETVFEQLTEHWVKFVTGAVFMAVGWYFGKRRAMARWQKKEFLDRLNVSLNVLQDGKLRIRTLLEKTCEEVFLNRVAAQNVMETARHTTESDPLLPLPKEDYWYYLNSVLNEVSERFADGQLRRDAGLPVTVTQYLICLTCEQAGAVRTRKVRAMLVQKSVLENMPEEQPELESPTHITRWETLQRMAEQWQELHRKSRPS